MSMMHLLEILVRTAIIVYLVVFVRNHAPESIIDHVNLDNFSSLSPCSTSSQCLNRDIMVRDFLRLSECYEYQRLKNNDQTETHGQRRSKGRRISCRLLLPSLLIQPAERRRRDIKDWYDAFYQNEAHHAQPYAERPYKEHDPFFSRFYDRGWKNSGDIRWRDQLNKRRQNSFLPTEVGNQGVLMDEKYEELLIFKDQQSLLASMEQTYKSLDTGKGSQNIPHCIIHPPIFHEIFRIFERKIMRIFIPPFSPLAMQNLYMAALYRFFDILALPTHKEITILFPWLDPEHRVPTYVHDDLPLSKALSRKQLRSIKRVKAALLFPPKYKAMLTPPMWMYAYSNPFYGFCELWNKEYIDRFISYLTYRIPQIIGKRTDGKRTEKTVTIAELGAGNGKLSFLLQKGVLAQPNLKHLDVKIVATDLVGRNFDATGAFPVQKMNHIDTIREFKPDIVICSWMSLGFDWTRDFWRFPSLKEYILIGEVDYGVNGDPWSTWGVGKPRGDQEKSTSYRDAGFERIDIPDLQLWQIGRTDSPRVRFHTRTTVFRRH